MPAPVVSLSAVAATDRELRVLSLMAQGRTNAAIVNALHLSQSAIEKHINAIFTKLASPRRPRRTAESPRS
jgi:DNA-binding NarL/FixJ family response regulator